LTITSILRDKDLFSRTGSLRALQSLVANRLAHACRSTSQHELKASTMDASSIADFGLALGAVACALLGFNALVGKGPRGTISIMAACMFTWAAFLTIVLRSPDDGTLSKNAELLITVLRLCGAVGMGWGIYDLFRPRSNDARFVVGDWLLRQSVLWGGVLTANFFAALYVGVIDSPKLWQYTAGHWVNMIEVAFFFIGMSFLAIRMGGLRWQLKSIDDVTLGLCPMDGQTPEECNQLLQILAELPHRFQGTYVVCRLKEALQFIRRKSSADELDQYMRHLEEMDALKMSSAYATLRIIIWAIPILGFLGTVIGITMAIASLTPEALEESMTEVTHGLGVAFDTTAEALALTMVLMFTKAWVERTEEKVLAGTDAKTSQELLGRFQTSSPPEDQNVAAIRRMSEQVICAVESLAARQAEVWKTSIDETHQQWADVSMAAGHIVKDSLTTAIRDNLEQHARVLGQNALKHADRVQATIDKQVETLDRGAQETVGRLREGLERLGELLVEALERHGDVLTKTEKELADENRQHLSEVEAALGSSMAAAAERQENLIHQSEHLLKEMQVALVEAAGATVSHQEQLVRQSDVLLKVVDSTNQIARLEESLTQNLAAVERAHSFEEMAVNLSAAIQLLSARLGHSPFTHRPQDVTTTQAA
jgi:biopolymer transport protein ExbB/TolQ